MNILAAADRHFRQQPRTQRQPGVIRSFVFLGHRIVPYTGPYIGGGPGAVDVVERRIRQLVRAGEAVEDTAHFPAAGRLEACAIFDAP